MKLYPSLAFLLVISSSTSVAGGLYMEAFEPQKCKHWYIEDVDFPSGGRTNFNEAKPGEIYWQKMSARLAESDTPLLADCAFQHVKKFDRFLLRACEISTDFPLSGASYKPIKDRALFHYKCTHGCMRNTPQFVYTVLEEEDKTNVYKAAYKKFQKRCGK